MDGSDMSRMTLIIFCFALIIVPMFTDHAGAQSPPVNTNSSETDNSPDGKSTGWTSIDPARLIEDAISPKKLSASLEIMLLLTVLSLAPAILVMITCFTRIVIVLALLRQAIGTQQLPPSQVIMGLALFMTFCVMAPTWKQINAHAIQPYINPPEGTTPIDQATAWNRTKTHMRRFMITQI